MSRQNSKAKRFVGYQVLWLLRENGEPYTIHEVAHEVGVNPHCAYRHLRELWSLELVYICGWDRTYRHWMPVYRWGNRPDKPRPEPLTDKEVRARKRQPDAVKGALKAVYMYHYERGTSWREALSEDMARG